MKKVGDKSTKRAKISPATEEYIRNNTQMTVKELSENTGLTQSQIYYFANKNGIQVKKRETTVEKFLDRI